MVSFNPKTNKIDLTEDNTTYTLGPNQQLIKVSDVSEEYMYIGKKYPEFEMLEQRLIHVDIGDRIIPVDIMRIKTNEGEKTLYFDIETYWQQYYTQQAQDTDYDRIYKIFRIRLAKNYPGVELKQEHTKKLFVQCIRGMTDNELVKSGKYPNKQSIPKQVSDDALSEFVKILKSKNKNKEYKAKIANLLNQIFMLDFVLNMTKQKEQIPENAIDRFFYKIGRGFKNTGATVKESQVVGKVIKILFRSGVWSIVAWLALWYVCGWIYMLIEEW